MTRFPYLTEEQRREVLKTTALPSGYPLDITGDETGWQRLNLSAAGRGFGAISGSVTVSLETARADGKTPGAGYNAYDVWANDIGGDGVLTKEGDGALTLSGNNSFAGIVIKGGAVNLTSNNAFSGLVDIDSGALSSTGSLAAKTIKVGNAAALNVSGALDAKTEVEGTLAAKDAHLTGNMKLAEGSRLELALASASQPALVVEGRDASLELAGDLSVTLPAGMKLCPGTRLTAIAARQGGEISGKPEKIEVSSALAAKSLGLDAEVKDNQLIVTLTGPASAACK